jgi:hypothetical protein
LSDFFETYIFGISAIDLIKKKSENNSRYRCKKVEKVEIFKKNFFLPKKFFPWNQGRKMIEKLKIQFFTKKISENFFEIFDFFTTVSGTIC